MSIHSKFAYCLKILIIVSASALIIFNAKNIYTFNIATRKPGPKIEPGEAYRDIAKNLKELHVVGFHTDKNMSSEKNDGDFLMAQYMMAPIVLDYNNTELPIHILSYKNQNNALVLIKKLNGKLIYHNQFGRAVLFSQNYKK